jgi:hypothetical protein
VILISAVWLNAQHSPLNVLMTIQGIECPTLDTG